MLEALATYVFIDLETTGLPAEEHNKTKITEISMVAVKSEHVLDTQPGASPRVQNKVTLCLNPGKIINPDCTKVTGLCNDILENETDFNLKVFEIINNFLDILQKPVCLIAQNGTAFDFPILKRQLEKLKINFSPDILCADCYHAFYDILEERKSHVHNGHTNFNVKDVPHEKEYIDDADLLLLDNTLFMKIINESTPLKPIKYKEIVNRRGVSKRRFPWSGSKPKESYKLKNIYERVMNRPAVGAHRAENDCILALECSVALGKDFVHWIDNNHMRFLEVKPMTIGVRLGY